MLGVPIDSLLEAHMSLGSILQFITVIVAILCVRILSKYARQAWERTFKKTIGITALSTSVILSLEYMMMAVVYIMIVLLRSGIGGESIPFSLGLKCLGLVYVYALMNTWIKQRVVSVVICALLIIIMWGIRTEDGYTIINHLNHMSIPLGRVTITPIGLVKSVSVAFGLFWLATLLSNWVTHQINRNRHIKSNTKALIAKIVDVVVYFLSGLIVLRSIGIDLTALTVVGGALGVGIGFGLQKITSNFISGVILLLEKSIEVDDLIEMDSGIYGFVRQISSRYTLIETYDGKEVMVPNEDFVTQRVTNWTFSHNRGRIEIHVGVSYASDIRLAHSLILAAAKAHPLTLKTIAPECHLREFGSSSVNFLLYCFVEDVTLGRFNVQSDIMFAIWDTFKAHNIEIPFPQQDVYIKEMPNQRSV